MYMMKSELNKQTEAGRNEVDDLFNRIRTMFKHHSEDDDDDEWEDTDEGESGEDDDEQSYDSAGGVSDEDGEAGRRRFMFMDCETKSRFTDYSLTSSVMRRNEQLTLLDDRFEKVGFITFFITSLHFFSAVQTEDT